MVAGVGVAGGRQIKEQRPRFLVMQGQGCARNLGTRHAQQANNNGGRDISHQQTSQTYSER